MTTTSCPRSSIPPLAPRWAPARRASSPAPRPRLVRAREGDIVRAALTREALPILRYRTGDLTSLNPEPCACGRTTARMARLKGRTDDMVVIKGVNVYPSQVEA